MGDLEEYRRTTLERFANPAIGDTLARLCRRGSVKMPSYLLPSLREAQEGGRPRAMLVLAVAAWLLYLRGADLAGRPIQVVEPRADELRELATLGGNDPRPLLGLRSVFGSLGDDAELVTEIGGALGVLSRYGIEAALRACGPWSKRRRRERFRIGETAAGGLTGRGRWPCFATPTVTCSPPSSRHSSRGADIINAFLAPVWC